jgi:hypothetical protein
LKRRAFARLPMELQWEADGCTSAARGCQGIKRGRETAVSLARLTSDWLFWCSKPVTVELNSNWLRKSLGTRGPLLAL